MPAVMSLEKRDSCAPEGRDWVLSCTASSILMMLNKELIRKMMVWMCKHGGQRERPVVRLNLISLILDIIHAQ